ncbi:TRAP transporter permease [Corynebacterium sp.]|jgi:TRAP transporter 4TM/12TM fusion protein|uniref:TRAP transporter permease n=1 Tax=Corynebacterium sp. TaxID=1720 RepID=UPI0025C4C393|nr:TRAP transporter permease [Corynebacterium sp.]
MTSPPLDRESTTDSTDSTDTTDSTLPTLTIDETAGEPVNPRLTLPWKVVVVVLTLTGIGTTMNQVFFWNLFGVALPTNSFLYLISACFLPLVIVFSPAAPRKAAKTPPDEVRCGVPWYDVLLIAVFIACALWFCARGTQIAEYGWALVAPTSASVLSFVYWALVVEVLRRAAGPIVAGLAFAVSLYPLVADVIPVGFLQGITYDPVTLAQTHVMGSDSINGLPLDTAATILVGFMLFGIVLQHTGGAAFFNDLAMSIFGKYRGGSAKVSVGSSAAMGMMSGSAVSNVLTTGPMTIPAMIKSGFSPKTAGAVEATASSGGSITPPVMGTAAFLMVSFIGVPYTEVLIAAALPAFLYFLGIFLQVDGYAARRRLTGTPKDQLPRFGRALVEGWPYITSIALLTLMLVLTPSEAQVPYWITALLIGIAVVRPSIPFGPRQVVAMVLDAGKSLGQIIGIIAGVGLILGGLSATGVALSLSRDLIVLVGENLLPILIAGALACFILGMGLTISAAYVFLAIVMAPAVTALGVEPIAAHLFIIYWASVSYITPPVGLAAFAAASISKASPMGTCVEAMKFGAVKYVVPFGFVLNPAIVAQGSVAEIAVAAVTSVVAVFALSAAFSGYLQFVEARVAVPFRVLLGAGGFLVFLPQWPVTLAGLAAVAVAVAGTKLLARRRPDDSTDNTDNEEKETVR